jgi:hypothetical protein
VISALEDEYNDYVEEEYDCDGSQARDVHVASDPEIAAQELAATESLLNAELSRMEAQLRDGVDTLCDDAGVLEDLKEIMDTDEELPDDNSLEDTNRTPPCFVGMSQSRICESQENICGIVCEEGNHIRTSLVPFSAEIFGDVPGSGERSEYGGRSSQNLL